ncbi:MAG: hypothetical protein ABI840_12850 [bacterium]
MSSLILSDSDEPDSIEGARRWDRLLDSSIASLIYPVTLSRISVALSLLSRFFFIISR